SSTGEVQIHSSAGWQALGRFSGGVPAAPRTVEGAAASLAPGTYDSIMVGEQRVALVVTVTSGVVEPVLLGVAQGGPDPAEAYAGQLSVNLGLRELAGRYPRVPSVQLEDQSGHSVLTSTWTSGITVLADFEDGVAGAQPAMVRLFAQLRQKLPSAHLIELTTDAARDTPAVLQDFARRYRVDWTLATGPAAAVRDVLATIGAAPQTGGIQASPVVNLVDSHGFVLRHFGGVPSAAQVLDAVATMQSPIPQSPLNRPEPAFDLASWSGTTLRPGNFGGKPLVVNFWASWCDPCRIEMPLLQQAANRNPGIAFLFVDERDNQSAARAFFAGLGLHGTVASDPDGTMAALFDVVSVPYTVFVSATGTIAGVQVGQIDQAAVDAHLADLRP
ncbi:MAG TPA: TlpA family protein disulfide reductase, partial [Candidatus Dormibacteraeota bacterium]|nr:TlpA family protein disulfide reductase [Candidatus Dormibacteraeota bacterium]